MNYPPNTRQWAIAEEKRLRDLGNETLNKSLEVEGIEHENLWFKAMDILDKADAIKERMHDLPDGSPIYSAKDFEEAGQGVLL